jgi:hypothetical protein
MIDHDRDKCIGASIRFASHAALISASLSLIGCVGPNRPDCILGIKDWVGPCAPGTAGYEAAQQAASQAPTYVPPRL